MTEITPGRMADYDRLVIDTIAEHGCFLQGVLPDGNNEHLSPSPWVYTVGGCLYDHPEIVVFLEMQKGATLLNYMLLHEVRDNHRVFAPGWVAEDDLLVGYPAYLIPVTATSGCDYPLSMANRFYRWSTLAEDDVSALQLVLPDQSKHFPWEEEYDPKMRLWQPLLGPAPQ